MALTSRRVTDSEKVGEVKKPANRSSEPGSAAPLTS
jgi:hypothetical protein